jgi:hypothetical protein
VPLARRAARRVPPSGHPSSSSILSNGIPGPRADAFTRPLGCRADGFAQQSPSAQQFERLPNDSEIS